MYKCILSLLMMYLFVCEATAQRQSPESLRSAARSLTVADLLGLAQTAREGNIHSQLLLGLTLQLIVERDRPAGKESGAPQVAAYWLKQAADNGSAEAQYFLAQLHTAFGPEGCGEVSTLLDKSIAQQYMPALTALGRLRLQGGCDFKMDRSLAISLLTKASSAGDGEAAYWLGWSYQRGVGGTADQREANKWFLKGAEMGDAACQNALGINVADGNGTHKNETRAVEWFRKSAEQGNYEAACNLAIHYLRGEGIAKNDRLALTWALISDRNNTDPSGYYCLDHIEIPKLNTQQVSDSTQEANAWLMAHHYPTTEPPKYTPE